MIIKKLSFFLCFLLSASMITTALPITQICTVDSQSHTIAPTSFDSLITLLLRIGHYPSMSACIIHNTTILWKNSYGFSNLETQKPATTQTIYIVASITKTITSTALMQLYDQGLFDLDDDVNAYLPFSLRNPNYPNDSITIRMILSHSSSLVTDPLSYHWFNFSSPPPIPWYPAPWLQEYLLPGGAYYTPEIWDTTHQPGTYMQYANINFDIAAYLVQLLSGQPFHEYCNDHIFTPLGMTRTGFRLPDLPIGDVAFPYLFENGSFIALPQYQLLHYPIGGLMTTIDDLTCFLIAHMNQGVYNGTRILQNDTVTLMHTIQPPGNIYRNFHYGLGFMIIEKPLQQTTHIGHSGDIPGAHTRMYINQAKNISIICFFNSDRSTILEKFISLLIQNLLFAQAENLT